MSEEAFLVLSDGDTYLGQMVAGADKIAAGEFVFNTAMSGYQEIITDPSYAGQIITFTYPHIGNYGVNPQDFEAPRPALHGVVVRDLARAPSNWRSNSTLGSFLEDFGVPVISGIDTRRLTRKIRDVGAIPGAFGPDREAVTAAARNARKTDGLDLVSLVTTSKAYTVGDALAPFDVLAYDFGIKQTILRQLINVGCRVTVVPSNTTANEVLERCPDGVFLSNGPGDPASVGIENEIACLVGKVPIFGICLGHQILGRALGGETFKLPFGHHGANHPVRNEKTQRVEITSQNHNYAIDPAAFLDIASTPNPITVFTSVNPLAPAEYAPIAIAAMSVTFGDSFTNTGKSTSANTASHTDPVSLALFAMISL